MITELHAAGELGDVALEDRLRRAVRDGDVDHALDIERRRGAGELDLLEA